MGSASRRPHHWHGQLAPAPASGPLGFATSKAPWCWEWIGGTAWQSPAGCLFSSGSSPGPSLVPPVWTGSGRSSGRTVGHTGVARGLCAPLAGRMPGTSAPACLALPQSLPLHDRCGAAESRSWWGRGTRQAPRPGTQALSCSLPVLQLGSWVPGPVIVSWGTGSTVPHPGRTQAGLGALGAPSPGVLAVLGVGRPRGGDGFARTQPWVL